MAEALRRQQDAAPLWPAAMTCAGAYAAGTRLATPSGVAAVETLAVGDLLRTASGQTLPVVRIGQREIRYASHPGAQDLLPVRVRAHAFTYGRPARDLILSPDHAIAAGGGLIPVRYLLNGESVLREPAEALSWWRLELPRHELLLAEGLPAETRYEPTGHAGLVGRAAADPLPLSLARKALLARLPHLETLLTPDAGLRVEADGERLIPQDYPEALCFALPDGARRLVLHSRSAVPAELDPAREDRRRLGVAVTQIWLDSEPIPLDDARLGTGWHQPERGLRWTSGAGVVDVRGIAVVELALAQTGLCYPMAAGAAAVP